MSGQNKNDYIKVDMSRYITEAIKKILTVETSCSYYAPLFFVLTLELRVLLFALS